MNNKNHNLINITMAMINDGTYDSIEETIFQSARLPMSGHPYYMPYFLYKNYDDYNNKIKRRDIEAEFLFKDGLKKVGTSLYVHPKANIRTRIILFLIKKITHNPK